MTPIRVLELRSVWGTGGGPDKTILAGAAVSHSSHSVPTLCYIRDARDSVFSIGLKAEELGLDYLEVLERHSFDLTIWPALRRVVRKRGIQIVHAHDHKTDLLAWLLSFVEPVIPLSTAHGFAGDSRREQVYYTVEKRILSRFRRVIAVSEQIKTELVRTGCRPDRVSVIPNGIDHNVFVRNHPARETVRQELGLSSGNFVIGAVGRLESEKRFDLLISAVAMLRRTDRSIRLVIAGDGRLRAQLTALGEKLGLDHDTCQLVGHRTDIRRLHSAFDVLVQSSDREGTPNVVLEAMALQTPIVATNVGGTCELVTDRVHGRLVPNGDAGELARAIAAVMTDPTATTQYVRAARHRVENELSFARRIARVEGIYEELITATRVCPAGQPPR